MVETLRLSPVIRLPQNKTLTLEKVRPPAKSLNLHAEAEATDIGKIAIVFGPANAAINEKTIVDAADEAKAKKYDHLLIAAFAINPKTRSNIEKIKDLYSEANHTLNASYIEINNDVNIGDLLKNQRTSEIFSICGLPDIALIKGKIEDKEQTYTVKLRGLDIFDPINSQTESKAGDDVPCWMLDTDYDGQCFRAGQVFFPRTSAWDNIKKAVHGEFDDSVWEKLASDESEPFVMGNNQQIAVKVIDDRGNELLRIKQQSEVE